MTAFINQNFTIHGTLSVTLGVSGANSTLQRSTDNATWKNGGGGDRCDAAANLITTSRLRVSTTIHMR